MNKRGKSPIQSGSPAVALIGIITLLFIGYILFLPAEERRALLEGENATSLEERILLDESPGRLEFTERAVNDHELANIYLAESKQAAVLAQENPFTVSTGWFSGQQKTMTFTLHEPEKTENIMLSFQTLERAGELIITLNGQPIFQGYIPVQNPPPVILPKQLLRSTNQLEFSVTGGFFSKKKYALTDIKVVGELVETERQTSSSTFTISESEKDHLDNAFLDFYAICEQQDVGPVTIELNGKAVYSSTPSCDSINRQDLYKEDLRESKNTLTFKITKGSYRFENIRVRTILKPVKSYIDYFTLKSELYDDILDRDFRVILRMEFVDDGEKKQAQLNVNGKFDAINQIDPEYEKDITTLVREGNNYVEIKPFTELNIVKLTIKAE